MVNEYLELETEFGDINISVSDVYMQILLANIYSHQGHLPEAYKRMLRFIELTEGSMYPYFFRNIELEKTNTADEVIELLKSKLRNCPLGITYDSYKQTLEFYIKRKNDLIVE